MMVLPIPPSIPPLWGWAWTGVWAGMGLVAVGAWRVGGAGDDDLPLDELLPPPPLPIIIKLIYE